MAKESKPVPTAAIGQTSSGQLKWYALAAAIIGFLLYINTVKNNYVLDDFNAIPRNAFVMQGISGIPKLMTIDFWYFENLKLGYYRPLSLITFAIEHSFFGEDPGVNHFDNALLYGLSGFILCLVLLQLFPKKHPAFSFLITLVFMAHPIHTEVVANIKSRDEILSFLNIVTTLFFVFRYSQTKQRKHLIWSIVFFYLALLSKETAVVGLALIPLFLFYSGLKIPEVLKRSLPYAGIALLFFLQKRYFLGTDTGIIPKDIINYPYANGGVRLPSTFHIFWICLEKLVYPLPLMYDYSYNQIPASHWSDMGTWLGVISFIGLAVVAVMGLLKRGIWSLGLSILFITIAPSLGFVFLRGGILAERFLYAPCLGFGLLLVYALSLIAKQQKERTMTLINWAKGNVVAVVVLLALSSFYSVATVQRNPTWKDPMTLFGTDVNHSTNSAQVHRHYGNALIEAAVAEKDTAKKRDYFNKGLVQLHQAIAIDTQFGEAYCQIGYANQAVFLNVDSAIKYFNRAIEVSPTLVTSYNDLGVLYQNMNQLRLASYYYNRSLEVNPHYPDAREHLEALKKATGLDVHVYPGDYKKNDNFPKEMVVTKTVKSANEKDFSYYFALGNNLVAKKDYKSAIGYFKQAEKLQPNNEQNLLYLANCYGIAGDFPAAVTIFKTILGYYPQDTAVMGNLAVTYDAMGQKAKADELRAKMGKK